MPTHFMMTGTGRLKLTKNGLRQRDQIVLHLCREMGLTEAAVMAGGYARHVSSTVDIHLQRVRCVADVAVSA